jgi:hypothetical protein
VEEIQPFRAALDAEPAARQLAETFVTPASPGIILTTLLRSANHPLYRDDEQYALAVAAAGHVLQLDGPDLALERLIMFVDQPLESFLKRVELHIDAINRAIRDIPRERVIANTDCGFSTFAGYAMVAGDVVWEKLRTMARDAEFATRTLWGNSGSHAS